MSDTNNDSNTPEFTEENCRSDNPEDNYTPYYDESQERIHRENEERYRQEEAKRDIERKIREEAERERDRRNKEIEEKCKREREIEKNLYNQKVAKQRAWESQQAKNSWSRYNDEKDQENKKRNPSDYLTGYQTGNLYKYKK